MINRDEFSEIYKQKSKDISDKNNTIFMNEVRRYFSEERLLREIKKSLDNNDNRVRINFKFNKKLDRVYNTNKKIEEYVNGMFEPRLNCRVTEEEVVHDYITTGEYYYELFFRFD